MLDDPIAAESVMGPYYPRATICPLTALKGAHRARALARIRGHLRDPARLPTAESGSSHHPRLAPGTAASRLRPAPPGTTPTGVQPANTRQWTNIADIGDVVAVPPSGVRDRFDDVDHDVETAIHVIDFHLVAHYLQTAAVAEALRR